ANAVGYDTWDEDTATFDKYFYFDSKSGTRKVGYDKTQTTSSYAWLFNNLGGTSTDASSNSTCLYYGCTMAKALSGEDAYWTSTSVAGISSRAWLVDYDGFFHSNYVSYVFGVRPVITLNSSNN
ncbi:MAG: hypothetical protein IJZ36_03690, partial [Bacilli bacterium]|nr:hypothetical protein [Bacilli bacterium]